MSWESAGISLLASSLVRPLLLAAAAWLVLRLGNVRHPSSRHAVWTAVLIGMLLLPAVSLLAPQWELPLLPARRPATAAGPTVPGVSIVSAPRDSLLTAPAAERRPAEPAAFPWPPLASSLLWLYLAGLVGMAVYRLLGQALLRQVLLRSRSIRGPWLRESADILTPVAVGVLHPTAILPVGWRAWSRQTRRAVLAHEFAHLRRHDAAVAGLAHLVQCLFWFHPLAWWLSRHIANLAELSCDAAALERMDDAAGYSRILLEFADAVHRAGRRVALPGLAMAAGPDMGRRIDEVFELSAGTLRRLSRPEIVLALVGLPVLALAATVALGRPVTPGPQAVAPQAAPTRPVQFEVASVKPCRDSLSSGGRGGGGFGKSGGRAGGPGGLSPERLDLNCETAMALIRSAYVRFAGGHFHAMPGNDPPIEGAPGWVNSDRYTIDAKAPSAAGQEMMRGPMLQALLEDRFHLKMHRESRDVPVWAMVVAKGGPKLKPFVEGSCVPFDPSKMTFPPTPRVIPPGQKSCRFFMEPAGQNILANVEGARIGDFCTQFLGIVLDRPVIDRTGLTGLFTFKVEFAADDNLPGLPSGARALAHGADAADGASAAAAPSGPSIFAALQEQLGLKLEPAKGPRDFLVIDHIEKPSEN